MVYPKKTGYSLKSSASAAFEIECFSSLINPFYAMLAVQISIHFKCMKILCFNVRPRLIYEKQPGNLGTYCWLLLYYSNTTIMAQVVNESC